MNKPAAPEVEVQNWQGFAETQFPGMDSDTFGDLLWNMTCYPFGTTDQVREQLLRAAQYWPTRWRRYGEIVDAEMDLAMGRMCPNDPATDGWGCEDTCEMCHGNHRIEHTPERAVELRAIIDGD